MFNANAPARAATCDLNSSQRGRFLHPTNAGLGRDAALLKRLGDVPVLTALFELPLTAAAESDVHVGWGSLPGNPAGTLTFRLQLGAQLYYWLADAADPYVWHALRHWDEAGFMCLLAVDAKLRGGAALACREFKLSPKFLRLDATGQGNSVWNEQFAQDCRDLLMGGALGQIASSDMPQWPKLKRVQGCAVETPFSMPFAR